MEFAERHRENTQRTQPYKHRDPLFLQKGDPSMKLYFILILTLLTFLILALLQNGFAQEPLLLNHGGGVRTVEFSPVDASLVASAGEEHTIKLWNLADNTVRTLIGHTGRVNSIAFSPNGELLASVSDDATIRLWSVHNQQNIVTLLGETWYRIVFSPDGQTFATSGRHIKLWKTVNRTEITTLQHNQYVQTIAFSSDGQLLAAGDGSGEGPGTVKVWNVQERSIIATLDGDPKDIKTVVFSPDDRYLASSGWDGQLKIWNTSNWTLIGTIPHTGYYDIDFSPDGNIIVSTNDGYVSLWWVEDGTKVAELRGPTGWMHPVDFSHDGTSLAVGAEDGRVRIWHIDTSLAGDGRGGVRILHIDTYLSQVPDANSANSFNIPEPVPPPPIVRDFFELDPFYKQYIDVSGLPVIASAQVNPYALKEAAWLITKMIGHRPEVLQSMVGNKARFSVIAHTEIITEIPEYHSDPRPGFLVFRERGWGGTEGATVTSSEENILNYPGDFSGGRYNILIHEFAHGIHILGLSALDPTFDERLRITYEAAMKKGLWKGTYASVDRREYWAEGTQAWFYPNGAGSFARFGNTRQALKTYDPDLAALLIEIYGDSEWRNTPILTRTDLPHLQGFNPQDSPTFAGFPELAALFQELRDPNSDGGGEWVNLKPYHPDKLSSLTESNVLGDTTAAIFVNLSKVDILLYSVDPNGTGEYYWTRARPGSIRDTPTNINRIWLVKDTSGRELVAFRTEEKIGRALIRSSEPVPVTLSHFRAEQTDAGVLIKWMTESELDNAGFYIYRSEAKDSEFKVVNPTLIQGAGTTSERHTYTWTDTTAKPNTVYYYRIEDVSHAGIRKQLSTVRMRGLVSASGKLTTIWADLKTQD
ncbi:WD40 repeat domain-containing protein [Candidatus Poribacteria bacterium]|nr:WD40 repeat domain-containing protein [Candidatus Poribacteria bacterium]MYG05023.1 WD40 repeat domain-containing protein [Candidatus Poribacteria bacterium]MYK21238.1 WD40 repeat domain-containing protein [Candidatus Poribacteria bacterium]